MSKLLSILLIGLVLVVNAEEGCQQDDELFYDHKLEKCVCVIIKEVYDRHVHEEIWVSDKQPPCREADSFFLIWYFISCLPFLALIIAASFLFFHIRRNHLRRQLRAQCNNVSSDKQHAQYHLPVYDFPPTYQTSIAQKHRVTSIPPVPTDNAVKQEQQAAVGQLSAPDLVLTSERRQEFIDNFDENSHPVKRNA